MVRYRRNFITGGTFFFTLTLLDRTSRALVEQIEALRAAMRETRRSHPFTIDAAVVLPDHLHIVMTLPQGDADYPNRWRLIKRRFTDSIAKFGTRSCVAETESRRCGNGDIGSTQFATTQISNGMGTTFILIR